MTIEPNAIASTADFEFAALAEAKNYRAALLRDFRNELRGSVLEVGCGIGQITSELLEIPAIEHVMSYRMQLLCAIACLASQSLIAPRDCCRSEV